MRCWMRTVAVSAMLVAVLALGLFVGDSGPALAQSDDVITLRVLNYLDLSVAGATREQAEIWKAFSKAHPEIKLEREDLFDEAFHQKTEAYAAAGQLPDVMYAWPGGRSTTFQLVDAVR